MVFQNEFSKQRINSCYRARFVVSSDLLVNVYVTLYDLVKSVESYITKLR